MPYNLVSEHAQGIQAKEPGFGRGAQGEQGRVLGAEVRILPPSPHTNTHCAPTHRSMNPTSMKFI